jgi:outer membrane protein assembly factor BamB
VGHLGLKDKRYYNGVLERRTTRCCSAVALAAVLTILTAAVAPPKKTDAGPLALVPVRSLWTLALNAQITQPPAYDDESGYFAIEGDRLVAYDLPAGSQKWIVDAKPSSALIAGGGFVFFVQGDALTALDASDGSVAWTAPLPDPLRVPLVWEAGWLIAAESDGHVSAVRANDGTLIWRQDIGSPAHASPAVFGDRVYVPAENTFVVALQIEDGKPVWQRRLGGVPNEIRAVKDRLFVGSNDNYLYCVDTTDGRVDWRWRAGADVAGVPAVDDRRVYFVSMDNVLRALNRSNGVQQWIQLLKLRPIGGPLKAGASIVVYGLQPPLLVFDLKDGKAAGNVVGGNHLAAPPRVFESSGQMPAILTITRDIATGDVLTLFGRTIEPIVAPFQPLPNPVATVPEL